MSPKLQPTANSARRLPAWLEGLQAAFHWMTVLPLPAPRVVDRRTGSWSITMLPVVGLVYGLIAWALAALCLALDLPVYLPAVAAVAVIVLGSRGLHSDGLADTIDGLGSYRPAAEALDIMRSGPVGPMGATAIVLQCLGLSAVFTAALDAGWIWLVVLAPLLGRLGVLTACLPPLQPTNPDGFGGMMIGTQTLLRWGLWVVVILGGTTAIVAVTPLPWVVVLSTLLGLSAACGFAAVWGRRLQRRFGGLNGDMLGAVSELATTVAATVMLLSAAILL